MRETESGNRGEGGGGVDYESLTSSMFLGALVAFMVLFVVFVYPQIIAWIFLEGGVKTRMFCCLAVHNIITEGTLSLLKSFKLKR